ncbi:hypothetical protein GF326_05085 [Candidatus Bathyarchaeota archaeon]|nr:hypothetical protein [Candidatus Bathyarchaeota archaeon]
MAENRDSSKENESDLENMGDLDMELDLNNDVSADMVELKNRMDKTDQEMRAMTEAMKSTLLDVRTLMQDMDNPFNMLRDMGVDKLVNKAVETVEGEVNKQKREETKKRLAGDNDEKEDPITVSIDGSTASHPGPPITKKIKNPEVTENSSPVSQKNKQHNPKTSQEVNESTEPIVEKNTSSSGKTSIPVNEGSQNMSYLEERMLNTENAVNEIAKTVNDLAASIHESNKRQKQIGALGVRNPKRYTQADDYYETYVNLVANYLQIRLGEKGSEAILLEGMYKEWASPKVVRDIMDKLSSEQTEDGFYSTNLSDVEDKLLITSLLRNLDKPVSEWGESTILFLILGLISRARENQANRS